MVPPRSGGYGAPSPAAQDAAILQILNWERPLTSRAPIRCFRNGACISQQESVMTFVRIAAAGALAMLIPAAARADIVTDWNATTMAVMQAAQVVGGAQTRTLAMVHVAISDAVNSIQNKYTRHAATIAITPGASAEAAAASAARQVLLQLVPNQKEAIEKAFAETTKGIPEGPAKSQGIAIGEQAAAAVAADRANDGAVVPDLYRPITTPGVWIPTAPPVTEQFARAKPWVLTGANQFRPGPPAALASALYARDYNETKSLGGLNSTTRSADQTAIVRFWTTPNLLPAWQAAARQFAARGELQLADCARLFALLNMAGANSYITDWDAKFTYNFWRPVTAIRNGDLDGNDATERDAGWRPLAVTPLHPEYPSQAAISAGVHLAVLEAVFGANPSGSIIATDTANPSSQRTVGSPAQLAEEHRNVRVWGGIHFRNSLDVASDMGRKITAYLVENAIKPVR